MRRRGKGRTNYHFEHKKNFEKELCVTALLLAGHALERLLCDDVLRMVRAVPTQARHGFRGEPGRRSVTASSPSSPPPSCVCVSAVTFLFSAVPSSGICGELSKITEDFYCNYDFLIYCHPRTLSFASNHFSSYKSLAITTILLFSCINVLSEPPIELFTAYTASFRPRAQQGELLRICDFEIRIRTKIATEERQEGNSNEAEG